MASSSENSYGMEAGPGDTGVRTVKDPTGDEAHTDDHKTSIVQRILMGELSAEQACEQEGLTTEELTEWVGPKRARTARRRAHLGIRKQSRCCHARARTCAFTSTSVGYIGGVPPR